MQGRARLVQAVASALDSGSTVLVSGPAGIGKTTVVRAVLRGRPHAAGTSLDSLRWKPYLPLSLALDEELHGEPETVASSVTRMLDGRILFIDDLQWADNATREVVSMIAGMVPVVTTVRTDDDAPPVALSDAVEIVVDPLDGTTSRALARKLHPDLTADEIDRLVGSAGGNPLLLEQLVHRGRTTPTLRAAATERLKAMPQPVRDLVTELALLRRPVPLDMFEVERGELPAGFVVRGGRSVTLVHDLLADAAVDALDEQSRKAAHRRLAMRLADHEAAEHYLAAGDMAAAAEAAARALESESDPVVRARALSIAADATGDVRLQLDTAAALVAIGDWTGAARAAASVETDDPTLSAEALLHTGRARWFSADLPGAREAIESGLQLAAGTGSATEVRLLVELANQRVRTEHAGRETTPVAEEALAAALRAGVDVSRARLVHATALAHDDRDGWEDAYRAVITTAAEAGDSESECAAAFFLASHYGLRGRTRAAIELLETFIERAGELGQYTWQVHMRAAALTDRFWAGDHPATLAKVCRHFIDEQPMFRNRAQIELVMALALADAGHVDEARARIDEVLRLLPTTDDQSLLLATGADLAWVAGDTKACLAYVDRAITVGPGYFGVLVAAVAAGAYAQFESGSGVSIEAPDVAAMPVFAAFGGEIAALRAAPATPDEAIATLDRIAAQWTAIGTTRFALRASWAAASIAVRSHHASARRRITTVHDEAIESELWWIRRRAATTLAQLDGVPSLTEREDAVIRLVGDGLTSRAIAERLGISRVTVETHIRGAMRKLGATTRRQAAALRFQHDGE
jgi:DNA-binding CsgD family transcriptional regulator/tetratricopeptide (TPR) repeat protein